jgi:3,4-dihydroxy 2-butanone 4-phosphate synthase/GTP cyclohydrolase II
MQSASAPVSVIKNLVKTRIPTGYGEFQLYLYSEHGKEHLALVIGDVAGAAGVPVRVHSECLTGDVFGSRRCDCGDQLRHTLQFLGRSPRGILIYLRQEGRGIGLRKKMEAYNLQDQGMDTVEANLHLGHQADERDYGSAARILRDLDVASIRLITNNPHKQVELESHGIRVDSRIPIEVGQNADNLGYLRSKAEKMAHWLTFREQVPESGELDFIEPLLDHLSLARSAGEDRPFVTLAYAQSLDGSIAVDSDAPYALSSRAALTLTHLLRARHDGLLVGVNTILSDDPQLTVRYCEGDSPRAVIVDSQLRTPVDCRVLKQAARPPLIVTTAASDPARRERLAAAGAELLVVDADAEGGVELRSALPALRSRGIRTLMVEGGSKIICTFLKQHLVNYCVITITPKLIGGLKAVDGFCRGGEQKPLTLADCRYQVLGSDIIAFGPVSFIDS